MNKAMVGATKKGYQAYEQHKPDTANPYMDKRKPSGKLTWSRAFMKTWDDGWRLARENQQSGDYRGWFDDRYLDTNRVII